MRVIYRGFTLIQITGGVWLVAALPGKPFITLEAAKSAIGGIIRDHAHPRRRRS